MESPSYTLAAELRGHTGDVRGVATTPDGRILSVSRDTTLRLWRGFPAYEECVVCTGHVHFVSAVLFLPPNVVPSLPAGAIVSASHDKTAIVWESEQGKLLTRLAGHTNVVCCLGYTPQGDLLSGSWDTTVRVWRNGSLLHQLVGHDHAVWAVLGLEDGRVLTASADKTLKLWQGEKCVRTYSGHTGVVRGIASLGDAGFVSCGNDESIRLWSWDGSCLQTLSGHGSFVYCVGVLPTGEIYSASEDKTVKIWREGTCLQTIHHPGSVWSVAHLPNGDLVTGCSDNMCRVFTRDASRVASAEALQAYEDLISTQAVPSNIVGDELRMDDLPGVERLQAPGTQDGEHAFVRVDNQIEVYSWSAGVQSWQKRGVVSSGVQPTMGKEMLNGKEYDYVFDVDLEDGDPPRKLGYNAGENPYDAAQAFVMREGITSEAVNQIVEFIIANSNSSSLPMTSCDPYTGGSRYIPGLEAGPVSSAPARAPARAPTRNEPFSASGGADPFTGAGRYIPGSAPSQQEQHLNKSQPRESRYFPLKSPVTMGDGKLERVMSKILEFNAILQGDPATALLALGENGKRCLSSLVDTLLDLGRYHQTTITDSELDAVDVLVKWPQTHLFPVLDLLRFLLLHPTSWLKYAERYKLKRGDILDTIVNRAFRDNNDIKACHLMGLRALANSIARPSFRHMLDHHLTEILEILGSFVDHPDANLRMALVTTYLNFSSVCIDRECPIPSDSKTQCLSAVVALLNESVDAEVTFRLLVCVGTLLYNDDECRRSALEDFELDTTIERLEHHETEKVQICAQDIRRLNM